MLVWMGILCTIPKFKKEEIIIEEIQTPTTQYILYPVLEVEETTSKPDIYEIASNDYINKMNELDTVEDKKKWFIEYKQLIERYSDELDTPETIYSCFKEEELDMLFRVVQAEIGDEWTFEHKVNVASAIFNRLESEEFPNEILEILTANQFATISSGVYKDVTVSYTTILACEYAFSIGDTTNGSVFFESGNGNVHASYADFVMNDGAHKFYR